MVLTDISSFFRSNCNLKKVYELHDTKLLIDGHGLQSILYRLSSAQQKDYIFSTDYPTYAEFIRKFLRRLKICQIVPIIVYDGSINSERYKTCFDSRIIEIRKIQRDGYECRTQSPTLANYVFTSVMREFGVEILQTCSQTLTQIAKLANKLKCPIMSDKKELFLLEIDFGIIPFEMLRWIKTQLHYNNISNYWFFTCYRFHIDYLLNQYFGLRREVIPLFATTIENDFITQSKYQELWKNTRSYQKNIYGSERHKNIDILLNWLRGKCVDEAIELLKSYLEKDSFKCEDHEKEAKIKLLMKKYELNGNNAILTNFVTEFDTECESSLREVEKLAEGDTESGLPKWFLEEYQKGIIRPSLMNIVKAKTHVLYPQIENFSLPSSFECTLTLRKFLYGLLRTDTNSITTIKVLDRNGLNGSEDEVIPLLYISDAREMPFLNTIRKLDIEQRKVLLMTILDISQSFINRSKVSLILFDWCEEKDMIDSWTFLIIIMRYWVANNKDYDWKPFIGALIISIIFYSRRDLRNDNKFIELCSGPELNHKFNPTIVHFYSQFQACLHIINFINSVLGYPLREGSPYYCLNGIFLYKATVNLMLTEDHEQYITELFGKWSFARLYYKILQLVLYGLDLDRLKSSVQRSQPLFSNNNT